MNTFEFSRFNTNLRALNTTFCEPVARNLEVSSALPGHRLVSLRFIKELSERPTSSVQKN